MKRVFKIIFFIFLTITTQIGGIIYLISEFLCIKLKWENKAKSLILFLILYLIGTLIISPILAPIFGRERIKNTDKIKPVNYVTILTNRNYVHPELNNILGKVEENLKGTKIEIKYLDANFPFIDNFPLLPHLSHNDGKKLDLSLIYETQKGIISTKQKSNSGYGVFAEPKGTEVNQIKECFNKGYSQYDYPKYLTFGKKNKELQFSVKGTKKLIQSILDQAEIGKLFIEPHLKERMKLKNNKIRYHGCKAVRHDDHIHIQLK